MLNLSRMKTETNLHKSHINRHGGVFASREERATVCANSPKWIFFNLKPKCAHPCQESTEMAWLWLFVTSPFFRDEWTTVNPFHVLYIRQAGYVIL